MSELTTLFQNTADAIRSKTGDTATMQASQFPAKIQGISVGISQDEADARYLQLSGGTMTGDLKVQESPASDKSAVSKGYAQGLFASALPKSGGTMTGALILNGAPTADNQAATKAYVDSKAGDIQELYSLGSKAITNWNNTNYEITFDNPPVSIIDKVKFLKLEFDVSDWASVTSVTLGVKIGSNDTCLKMIISKYMLTQTHFESLLPISALLVNTPTMRWSTTTVSWAQFYWYNGSETSTRGNHTATVNITRSGSGGGAGTFSLSLWG